VTGLVKARMLLHLWKRSHGRKSLTSTFYTEYGGGASYLKC